jgi:carboxypeptidase PM20D1
MMSAALARLEDHRLPMQISGIVAEMFDTLAPEMNGFNRVVLSNLWLFKPLLLREFEKSGPTEAMVRTTTALTIFNAGNKDNVLPGNAEASVNFRLMPGDTQASVTDHVRRTVNDSRISIEPFPGNAEPTPVTDIASPAFQTLNRTIREVFPDVIVAPGLMLAGTDSRHYVGITDKIFRFSPDPGSSMICPGASSVPAPGCRSMSRPGSDWWPSLPSRPTERPARGAAPCRSSRSPSRRPPRGWRTCTGL